MKSENKQCQNCKQNFTIEPEDFSFCENIKVPPPTWCPECRLVRRCINMGNRSLYKDSCELCKKNTLSSFHPEEPFAVYCSPCWWSDKWDARDFGKEYDFSRPFLEQFEKLFSHRPTASNHNDKMRKLQILRRNHKLKKLLPKLRLLLLRRLPLLLHSPILPHIRGLRLWSKYGSHLRDVQLRQRT